MIRFFCQCGRQLQASEVNIGAPARCPLCQRVTIVPETDQPRTTDFPPVPPRGEVNEHGEIMRLKPVEQKDDLPDDIPLRRSRSRYDDDDDDYDRSRRRRSPFQRGGGQQNCQDAQTALILGVLGIFCCQLASPFALVYGIKALNQIKASDGQLTGNGQAITGIVLGCLGLFLMLLNIFFIAMSP